MTMRKEKWKNFNLVFFIKNMATLWEIMDDTAKAENLNNLDKKITQSMLAVATEMKKEIEELFVDVGDGFEAVDDHFYQISKGDWEALLSSLKIERSKG